MSKWMTEREMTYIPPFMKKKPTAWVDAALLGLLIGLMVGLVLTVKQLVIDPALHPWKAEAASDERYYCENLGSFRLTDEGDRDEAERYCTQLLER